MPSSHDPIPYSRVAELIAEAAPSRQSALLHDAWRDYAARAVRPYAWKTFAKYAREHFLETGDWMPNTPAKEKLTPWQDGARASPRVLVLGAYAALRVRGGALEIEHGPHDDRKTIRIDIDAEPKPRAILFDSHGEFMTGEAMQLSTETESCPWRLEAGNAATGRKSQSLWAFLCPHGAHVPDISGTFRETKKRAISMSWLVERRGFKPRRIWRCVGERERFSCRF